MLRGIGDVKLEIRWDGAVIGAEGLETPFRILGCADGPDELDAILFSRVPC